jgi:hypothetical protein
MPLFLIPHLRERERERERENNIFPENELKSLRKGGGGGEGGGVSPINILREHSRGKAMHGINKCVWHRDRGRTFTRR